MATHSSVLAWRIPGTGEPGGLPSMGSHRVGHDWSDLAAAAAVRVSIGLSHDLAAQIMRKSHLFWSKIISCIKGLGRVSNVYGKHFKIYSSHFAGCRASGCLLSEGRQWQSCFPFCLSTPRPRQPLQSPDSGLGVGGVLVTAHPRTLQWGWEGEGLGMRRTFCHFTAAAAAKSLQSCPTLCNPIDGCPPGSPVPGILQARTLDYPLANLETAEPKRN